MAKVESREEWALSNTSIQENYKLLNIKFIFHSCLIKKAIGYQLSAIRYGKPVPPLRPEVPSSSGQLNAEAIASFLASSTLWKEDRLSFLA